MPASSTRVVVALSGGVDSSVAAALLVEQGYQVIGMMLRLWSEDGREADNRCCTPDAMGMARRVAARLEIPFYALDAQQEHYNQVVHTFIDGYAKGITPNPCLSCNSQVRWGFLWERAQAMGASFLATGHYARLERQTDGNVQLLAARDPTKDQSYVLHVLKQSQLAHTLLPLGEYTKSEVREIARELRLPAADRSDSQDLCFLGGDDYRLFLQRNAPHLYQPGEIVTQDGQRIGAHAGLVNYTIGQRKGLGGGSQAPFYVLSKDIPSNRLVVGTSSELGSNRLSAANLTWIAGEAPAPIFRAQVKIRYKAQPAQATVDLHSAGINSQEETAVVIFDQSQRDITPGQAAVFYDGSQCLGGGIIQ